MKKHPLILPWLIWSSSAIFVVFQFFLQLSSGVIVDDLMRSFAIDALGAGILSSTYYYVYVALQTPAGILIDRYGPRKLLAWGGVVCGVGCLFFGVAKHLPLAEFSRVLMGGGSSFAFVGSLYLITQWFPGNKFALMVGIAETVGTLGTLIGNIFLAVVVHSLGWRVCMIGAGGIAILIALLCWIIIRDKPENNSPPYESLLKEEHFLEHTMTLLKNPKAWFNGIYSGLQFSIVTVFVALWGIPFLVKAHHISVPLATIVSSSIFLGLAVGCPIVGAYCSRITHRTYFLSACGLLSAICLVVVLLGTHLPLYIISFFIFVIGLLCSSYVLNFAIAKEMVPDTATSTSIGFANTLSVITAPILQPIVGALIHFVHKGPTMGALDYSIYDFQIALMVLPLGLVVAAVIALYIE